MKKTYWLIGASIATIGTTLALTSCSQQQAPQKQGYITFESTSKFASGSTKPWITNLTKTKTYDVNGFVTSYDPNTIYELNDKFMNELLKIKDEWNIYFYHSNIESGAYSPWKWYNLAEYYNVVYKGVPKTKKNTIGTLF